MDITAVLKDEAAAVPPALFDDGKFMRKTNKSDLTRKLQSVCSELYSLPADPHQPNAACIIDGT